MINPLVSHIATDKQVTYTPGEGTITQKPTKLRGGGGEKVEITDLNWAHQIRPRGRRRDWRKVGITDSRWALQIRP